MFKTLTLTACAVTALASVSPAAARFTHPGCLSTQEDLDRMAAKIAAGEQPWKGSWDILARNTDGFLDDSPGVQPTINAGRGGGGENFMRLARDAAKAYQLALRHHGSGDPKYADKAVEILNAWASGHEGWGGDTNVSLRAGLYGYQFACAAELLREYGGWRNPDFRSFQDYMKEQFHGFNKDFLHRRHGTVPGHYWANWNLANLASMMAIGVLCDDREIFDEALEFFHHGEGNESLANAVPFVHPNGLGQWQESGRDQGHSLMGPQLMGVICEIAWNQGVDLYGSMDNRFLAAVEYISKYNLGHEVPYVTYVRKWKHPGSEGIDVRGSISSHGRGSVRPGWDLVYHHYVNRRGLAAPYTELYAEKARPEGGGFNHGGNSGGFDGLGFTTLTHSRDRVGSGAVPGALRPTVEGRRVTLAWEGSARAEGYTVKRSATRGGPYETVARTDADLLYYVDPGLTPGTTYYYVVSANHPDGEGENSEEAAARVDGRLHGTVIGTDGSHNDSGADKYTVFDGYLENHFDGPESESWVGLDLGRGVSAEITGVKYCPREDFAGRMVGGRFQGSDTADFSSGVRDLFTISEAPPEGELTERPIDGDGAFRYVRYLSPEGGHGNAAEIEFHGSADGLDGLSPPEGVGATPASGSRIDLEWNAVSGAERYCVARALRKGGPYVIVGYPTDADFRDTGLSADTAYHYLIAAMNAAGASEFMDAMVSAETH